MSGMGGRLNRSVEAPPSFFGVRQALLLGLILAAAILAYLPGLSGGFAFDDYSNIVSNPTVRLDSLSVTGLLEAAQGGGAGPLRRPLSTMSFAVNHALSGLSPLGFKLTNLVIHLINGLLIYALAVRLLGAVPRASSAPAVDFRWVALAAAGLWLLHPINLTSVLYVVQRMTSLSALFTLLGLWLYCVARLRMLDGRGSGTILLAATVVCGLLAMLAKESGALFFLYAFVCEVCIFRFGGGLKVRRLVQAYFLALLALPVAALAGFLLLNPEWLSGRYAFREFTLEERLLTQSRVLWFYLGLLALPAVSRLGLFHDHFSLSAGLFSPPVTALAIGGLAALAIAALLLRRRHPVLALGALWFLAGHAMESTVLPLELVHEHRNYLPGFGPLLAGVYVLFNLPARAAHPRLLRAGVVGFMASMAVVTAIRAQQWSDPITLAVMEAVHHPHSQRAVYELGRTYAVAFEFEGDPSHLDEARAYFQRAMDSGAESNLLPAIALVQVNYMQQRQPPLGLLETLNLRLERERFQPTTVTGLQRLVHCALKGPCGLHPTQIMELFGSALENPTLRPAYRAQLLETLGAYYANGLGDYPATVRVFEQVVAQHPDMLRYRISLIQSLIAAGDNHRAMGEIRRAREVRRWRDAALTMGRPARILDELAVSLESGSG